MLIMLIVALMLVIGVGCLKVSDSTESGGAFGVGIGFTFIGFIGLVVLLTITICVQCTKQVDYEEMVEVRQMLEYRLENKEENLTGNELLYDDILDFNRTIRKAKRYSKSPWTNWFTNDLIAELEPIDIYGGTE